MTAMRGGATVSMPILSRGRRLQGAGSALAALLLLVTAWAPTPAAQKLCFEQQNIAVPDLFTMVEAPSDGIAGSESSAAVDSATSRAFIANGFGTLTVLDTRSGRLLRSVRVPACDSCQLPVDTRRGRVLAIGTAGTASGPPTVISGTVAVLDARSGRLLHTTLVPGVGLLLSAIDGQSGRVFAYEYRNTATAAGVAVAVFDSRTGALLRTTPLSITGAPVVSERFDRVFVPVAHGLAVLDARSGWLLHTLRGPISGPYGALAVDDAAGRLYDAYLQRGQRPRVAVLALPSGRLLQTLTIATGAILVRLLLDPQAARLIVVVPDYQTILIDTRTERRVGTIPAFILSVVGLDTRRGLLYVTQIGDTNQYGEPIGPGRVFIYDVRHGAFVGGIPVGIGAGTVSVDERTGTVVVVSKGQLDVLVPGSSGRCFKAPPR